MRGKGEVQEAKKCAYVIYEWSLSEAAVYVEDRSHCSQFCLWTHLHGWRQLALTKNKGK